MIVKWEYSLVTNGPVDLRDFDTGEKVCKMLNEWGQHGWELVSVTQVGAVYSYFMKRRCES